jgi:tRNA (guanine-N7-)-methyltransferase
VNPLSRAFQQPTTLPDNWPRNVFSDCNKPLHVDIGCGKGGFLIDSVKVARAKLNEGTSELHYNYLGLEIRPGVAHYAKERIAIHNMTGVLEFLGCNANVDLERIVRRYQKGSDTSSDGTKNELPMLQLVTIQFPDPHFKSHHSKRRVVTPQLINSLAKFMPPGARVFLQSDVQSVLDDMRLRFRENVYFMDTVNSIEDYLGENPLSIPTEREASVLANDKPVYRSLFKRTTVAP